MMARIVGAHPVPKAAALLLASLFAAAPVGAAPIHLTQISTPFNTPIGIDYHEPTNSVIASVNYFSGSPHNLERINLDGSHTQFSALAGLTDELKIATVRSGNVGGFTTGDVFTGNGADGQIVKVSGGGSTVLNPWISLPGANGLVRGSLYVDRTGVWGGDLIAVTTAGQVWRVDSAATPTLVASVGQHLEGVMTVPNDPSKYGFLAGKIIAGSEGTGRLYYFDTAGSVDSILPGVAIEDIDLITGTENFFGVNFGTGRILGAPASEFAGMAGDILLTRESHSGVGLYQFHWDGANFVTTQFTLAAGSATPGQWEHVTFAPAGIREIPPVGTPEPASLLLLAGGLAGLAAARRRRPASPA